jgi:hypothetical protein
MATTEEFFTLEEFDHIKQCSVCFQHWSQFIHDAIREQQKNSD